MHGDGGGVPLKIAEDATPEEVQDRRLKQLERLRLEAQSNIEAGQQIVDINKTRYDALTAAITALMEVGP